MSNRTYAVAACAALIACAVAGPAKAHVVLDVREAPAGSYFKAMFRVGHGCEGSSTTRVAVSIPDGIYSVRPQMKPGWEIAISKKKLEKPVEGPHGKTITEVITEVAWIGGPLQDAYFDEFGLQMKLPDTAPGGELNFPVVQTCEQGSRGWVEIPAPGQSRWKLKSPAPALQLIPKPASHKH